MRRLAAFSVESLGEDRVPFGTVIEKVESWIGQKGTTAGSPEEILLPGGKIATVERADFLSSAGIVQRFIVKEPVEHGIFTTEVDAVEWEEGTALSIVLASASEAMSPQWLDVRRPRVLLELISETSPWEFKGTPVTATSTIFAGKDGGDRFAEFVWSDQRSLPVVAVSNEYGADLHPGICNDLASDLVGLAIVASIDQEASWCLTTTKTKEWSVYGGAIRLYWPGIQPTSSPFDHHKLWTAQKLMWNTDSTQHAASRLRNQLRKTILAQSAFSVPRNANIDRVLRASRSEEIAALKSKASSVNDFNEINEKLELRVIELEEERDAATARADSLAEALQFSQIAQQDSIAPETEAPPSTVTEAVELAKKRYSETLLFGDDVPTGIESLAPNAGPPQKILDCLFTLHELAVAHASGPLGQNVSKWVADRGCPCSGESETIKNSPAEMAKRTWKVSAEHSQTFELHQKPSTATSPDHCVRIYFEYDPSMKKTVVGWVGRKPGT
ncbi:hypothetical protein [Botrimarina sp.]|uniref:hypothetical protein n=1 Tax=Botrimarina sp. TaxID=2795802 RepID=UPI0032ECB7B1